MLPVLKTNIKVFICLLMCFCKSADLRPQNTFNSNESKCGYAVGRTKKTKDFSEIIYN